MSTPADEVPAPFQNAPQPPAPAPAPAPRNAAELRAEKARRVAAAEVEREANELAKIELELRFEDQLKGPPGRAFAIVDASDVGEGHIVVKLGEPVLFNTFKASKMNVMDQDAFVVGCLAHPSPDAYRMATARRPMIADRCCNVLAKLYGFKADEDAGK